MINAGTAVAYLDLDTSRFSANLQSAGAQLSTFADSTESWGNRFAGLGAGLKSAGASLSAGLTLPLAAVGGLAVNAAADFESAMSEVQAISGATGADLVKLEEKAKEMGATTKFSASESAEAMKYMAMAGWDATQMADGLSGVIDLAAASGEELGTVSDIVTDALTAFGMQASDSTEFADLLASASSNANTNVSMLGESFKHVAPVAGALGYTAEDTAFALSLMANAGVKGSQAGTSLKAAMTRMTKPTKEAAEIMSSLGLSMTDANGEMLPFSDTMVQLREKFSGLTEEQQAQYAATLFGQESMSGMLAIVNASEADFQKLTDATSNYAGTAKRMAEIMRDNLNGQLELFKSAVAGAAISIGEILLPMIKSLISTINGWVDSFNNLSQSQKEMIVKIGLVVAAIGPMLLVFGQVASLISGVIGVFGALSSAVGAVSSAMVVMGGGISSIPFALAALMGPVGLATAGIAGITAAGIALYKHFSKDSIPEVNRFGEEVSESTQKALGAFFELSDGAQVKLNELAWSGKAVSEDAAKSISDSYAKMASQIISGVDEAKNEALQSLQTLVDNSKELSEEEKQALLKGTAEAYESKKQIIQDGQARIEEILNAAVEANRRTTQAEEDEINAIKKSMNEQAVQYLTESELEQKAIMERMKAQAGELSAQQAAEVVRNSKEQTDNSIAEAERQYNGVVKNIILQRDELGRISEEQAQKLIDEAGRQRDEAVIKAKSMHEQVVAEAKSQAEEHVNEVDWSTGEIRSKWDVMTKNAAEATEEWCTNSTKWMDDMAQKGVDAIGEFVGDTIEFFKSWGSTAKENVGKVKDSIADTWDSVVASAGTWIEDMKQAGKDLAQGLLDGIGNMKQSVIDKAKELAGAIPEWLKKVLNIQSPSRVTMQIGSYVGQGLVEGMNNEKNQVGTKSKELADIVSNALGQINDYVDDTVTLIEKKYKLWITQNQAVEGSSEALSRKLDVQKEKHSALNQQIENTQTALAEIIAKYGESSSEALGYKNELLDLQIEQAKVSNEIDKTSTALQNMANEYKYVGQVMSDGSIYKGINSLGQAIYEQGGSSNSGGTDPSPGSDGKYDWERDDRTDEERESSRRDRSKKRKQRREAQQAFEDAKAQAKEWHEEIRDTLFSDLVNDLDEIPKLISTNGLFDNFKFDDIFRKAKRNTETFGQAIHETYRQIEQKSTTYIDSINSRHDLWMAQNEKTASSEEKLAMQLYKQEAIQAVLAQKYEAMQSTLKEVKRAYGSTSEEFLAFEQNVIDVQLEIEKLGGTFDDASASMDSIPIEQRVAEYDDLSETVEKQMVLVEKSCEVYRRENNIAQGSVEDLSLALDEQQAKQLLLQDRMDSAKTLLEAMSEAYGENSSEVVDLKLEILDMEDTLISYENEMANIQAQANEHTFANQAAEAKDFGATMETQIAIIDSQFTLWKLKNGEVEGSSATLGQELEVLMQKQSLVAQYAALMQSALSAAKAEFGENSEEVKSYTADLLDVQIMQEEIANSIKKIKTSGSSSSHSRSSNSSSRSTATRQREKDPLEDEIEAFKEYEQQMKQVLSLIDKEYELWKAENVELEGSIEDLNEQQNANVKAQTQLSEQIKATEEFLEIIKTKYDENSDIVLRYTDKLYDLKIQSTELSNAIVENNEVISAFGEEVENVEEDIESLAESQEELISQADDLGDALMSALEKQYEKRYGSAKEHHEKVLDQVEKSYERKKAFYESESEAKINSLNKQRDAELELLDIQTGGKISALQSQIDSLLEMDEAQEKANKEKERQKAIQEKQEEMASTRSVEKRAEIQQEIDELELKFQKEREKEKRAQQIEHLREQIANVESNAEAEKEAINARYDDEIKTQEQFYQAKLENLEKDYDAFIVYKQKEFKAVEKHYEHLMSEENLQHEARMLMTTQRNDEIISLLGAYEPDWLDKGKSFGEKLIEGLESTRANIQSTVNSILSLVNQGRQAASSISSSTGSIKAAVEVAQAVRVDTLATGTPRVEMLDYAELGKAVASNIKPSINQKIENHFTPAESTPAQHAKKQQQMLRSLAFQYR